MGRFRKLPVIIDAFKYDGDLKKSTGDYYAPEWAVKALKNGTLFYDYHPTAVISPPTELFIKTLEGDLHVSVGDYVIKDTNGELYACKPDIFEKTYEPIDLEAVNGTV